MSQSEGNLTKNDFTREELENFNVSDPNDTDLRDIARQVVGKGAWVSHAHKKDLITAILEGEPPQRVHERRFSRTDLHKEAQSVSTEETMEEMREELQSTASSAANLMRRAIRMELGPILNRLDRLEHVLEEELGVEFGEGEDQKSALDIIEEEMVGDRVAKEVAE